MRMAANLRRRADRHADWPAALCTRQQADERTFHEALDEVVVPRGLRVLVASCGLLHAHLQVFHAPICVTRTI